MILAFRLSVVLRLGLLPVALADRIGDDNQQPSATVAVLETGSGDAYASSCQSALWAWQASSSAYGRANPTSILSTAPRYPTGAPSVSAESVTVLCDGYSRAVGSASFVSLPQNGSQTFTAPVYAPYPTPMPCRIEASDCVNLYRSYSSVVSTLIHDNSTVLAPPCATNGSQSIPFSTRLCKNGGLRVPVGVRGSSVQLLYWPVRTTEDSAYFCTQAAYSTGTSPSVIPGTRTRPDSGPNTFVVDSTLTITSPTIALSYGGISRVDRCGPTLDSAIITMKPEDLMSIRGGRSLFDARPFNFGDLNWMCPSLGNSSHFTVQDTQGPNCYQNVPAEAYWSAAQRFDLALYHDPSEIKHWTIVNNYQPYVAPRSGVWHESLTSLWGASAYWDIDGSWDPPIALSEQASVAKPTYATSTEQSSTVRSTTLTTKPAPAHLSSTLPASTSTAHNAPSSHIPSPTGADHAYDSMPTGPVASDPDPSFEETAEHVAPSAGMPNPSKSAMDRSTGSQMAVVGTETLSGASPGHTASEHGFSAASTGLMMDEGGSTRLHSESATSAIDRLPVTDSGAPSISIQRAYGMRQVCIFIIVNLSMLYEGGLLV